MRSPAKEAAAAAMALAALAVAVYGSNVIDGGFLSDAWANRAIYVFAPHQGFFGGIDRFFDEPNIAARPLYAVYLGALNTVLDSHMGFWLAWLDATSVLMSFGLYLLLRKLDFELLDAALIAALVLIFPAASSLRLWAATVQIPVAVSLAVFGFLVALEAFDSKGGRRLSLHGVSLALFVASLLFYEAALPLMLVSVLLYRLRVPWSRAARRWALDVLVLVAVAIVTTSSAPAAKEVQGVAGSWDHARAIFDQIWTLLAFDVLPFGSDGWYVLGLAGLVPLTAALVAWRLPREDQARVRLCRWLAVLAGGLLVVFLGYSVFVPGIDYYAPLGPGIANRINAVPSIGWVVSLYALIMLSATLAFRGLRASRALTSGLASLACVLVAVGWLQVVSRDSDAFTQAYGEDKRVLAAIRYVLPDPPAGSTIWTFGQPVEIVPGVPVFGNTWDMTTSVQLAYGDPTILSFVGYAGTTFACRPGGIVPGGPAYPVAEPQLISAYGRTYFVETITGRLQRIDTPAQCRHAAASFPRSPYFLGEPAPAAPAPSSSAPYRLAANDTVLVGPSGQRIPVRPDAVTGYIDSVAIAVEGVSVNVSGWAVAGSLAHPARQMVGIVGGIGVAQAEPSAKRPDIVKAFDKPALRFSGFALPIKTSVLECTAAASGLTVYGIADGVATPLTLLGNSKRLLDAAC